MKKLTIILALVCAVSVASAQSSEKPLKGPKAKNYKPWMDKNKTSVTLQTTEVDKVQGPEAKNQKVWKRRQSSATLVRFGSPRSKLKGPEYKNFKY